MKTVLIAAVLFMLAAASHGQNLKCDVGPVSKTFGGTAWLVYACNDKASIVLVSAGDSKAFPFFFAVQVSAGKIHIHGEGTGNKALADKAAKELQALILAEIERFRQEALLAAPRNP